MASVFLSHNNIVSNLGFDSSTVVDNISNGNSGLHLIQNEELLPEAFCASILPKEELSKQFANYASPLAYTHLEQMMILSLKEVIDKSELELNEEVGLIISTTKGNIDVLSEKNSFPKPRVYLNELGEIIKSYFGFKTEPIVLSNACVSGVLAVSVAKRFILQGKYKHIFIVSGDLVTKFTLSGFSSFQALSSQACKPYDKNREGVNLGEAVASVLVTSSKENLAEEAVSILGDSTRNDANHISGPSRTGEGLYRAVDSALKEAQLRVDEIDYISAHGTATLFNDEMEAIAFNRLGMSAIPLNSLKGYFGHTLGASGLLETIIGMHSLKKGVLIASKGFNEIGVSKPLNIIETIEEKTLKIFLKTASGFGGCNTAVIFQKVY